MRDGKIRRKQEDAQICQAGCLMTNAMAVWNTLYMQETLRQMKEAARAARDELLQHLSSARFEHIHRYGRYLL